MIQNDISNPDVCFWVLARPADTLSALARQVLPAGAERCFFTCIYDVIGALLNLGTHTPVVLLARPAMLAKPHLPTILQRFPNLRMIGWLTPGENAEPFITAHAALPMVTVSRPVELIRAADALAESLSAVPRPEASGSHGHAAVLDPAHYRLSNEELDALLGADQ